MSIFDRKKVFEKYNLDMEELETAPATRSVPSLQTQNDVLKVLKTFEGEILRLDDIASVVDISASTVANVLRTLIFKGSIRRHGKKGSYTYEVNHSRTNGPRKPVTGEKATVYLSPQGKSKRKLGVQDAILDYISKHQEVYLTNSPIAKALGVRTSYVYQAIQRLVDSGRIVKSSPIAGQGAKYRVVYGNKFKPAEVQGPNLPEAKEVKLVAHSDNSHLLSALDSLVWEFVKSSKGDMNVLSFLAWLEQRK